MLLLKIYAEGQTEHTFVERILKPYLEREEFGYTVSTVSYNGLSRYQQFKDDTLRIKKGVHDGLLTTMVDLYGLPNDFPGMGEIKTFDDPQKKVEYLEKKLEEDLHIDKFIPYIQLHEFEALLFSDINQINHVLSRDLPHSLLPKLQRVLFDYGSPENIDHDKGPSLHLNDIYPKYKSAKTHLGYEIAKNIGLPTMREECKHFGQWLTKLEKYACGKD